MLVVIPCEGGPAYSLARRISAQRLFEKTYGTPYGPFIRREHLNIPSEVIGELRRYFEIDRRRYFPLRVVPSTACNLCIGLALRPRVDVTG